MNYQVQSVVKETNKALKVIVETKKKLEKCKEVALGFIGQNNHDIHSKEDEITKLANVNKELEAHIATLDNSIAETDKILGVK